MVDLTNLGTMNIAALGALAGAALVFAVVVLLAIYIYASIALMTIAKKTRTKRAWLAWIPLANIYLMTQIGKTPWWTMLLLLFAGIPMIGAALAIGLTIYWWWNIAEVRRMPGWLGILAGVPGVNLVVMGYIAWAK